ncbi:MATH and LRR domain-containing protein PFE0570w-like [Chrysoperla carnea]|uniref:MATH and LRR domain-containing protein PFE0570w-like n=1 Tax=Chrysoperla carnea TaxID=189513 RepID=UPI001D088737|nr:MATH and LRR domain-containing protein PFE0570w-like [Chrysoperla carnea]
MDPNSERTLTENDIVGVGNDVSQIENGCVFRLLKVDENVNTDNITTLEMKSLNGKSQAKRPSNWDNMNERSSKKLKTNLNGQNENNEFPSTSKSDENKIETNGIKIEAIDENSVDMFSENPIEKHQIKTENITISSLLDSDEEENAYIDNNYVPPKHDDDYIIISSDDDDDDEEEDNPWLERLSQRSNYSPPPLSDSWAEKEGGENNEWWPELSQKFLDEINQEDETPDPNKVHDNIKTSKEPDKNSNNIELKECRITIQDVNKCFKNNETLNSIVNNLRKERPAIKKKDDPNSELRKQRLKELAIAKSNKSEQSPNTDHKEKMKPKVKCTTRNRSDLFTAEILKTSDKPATCISKSTEKLSVGKPSTKNSKSNDKIPTLKSTEISHKYPIRVKSNDKLLPPTINYNEIIGNNDSIKKLPSFKKKEIIQNTETNKQTSNKNKSTKRVSFNLTPSIRLFTRESHEEAPPFFLFRDRRYYL